MCGPDLIEICFLEHLPPSLWVDWQNTDTIAQEVEDEAKVLRVSVNENTSLHR